MYGLHAVQAALANPARRRGALLATRNAVARLGQLPDGTELSVVDRRRIDRLAGSDAVHQGVALQVWPLPHLGLAEACRLTPCAVLLDRVTDPRNVGAILRSVAAFGGGAAILQRRHAPQESALLAKAASGALERVALVYETNLSRALAALAELGFLTVGLDPGATQALRTVDLRPPVALVLGAEGQGLRDGVRQQCALLASLPIDASSGSLNVSAAAAIALYEAENWRTKHQSPVNRTL